ncbi:MAG TPA: HAMP domain-containing sensor histidine kinase [Alphaproteobacteria bacterium]|nr:HAMP domain-containing sensor histidine kinase [Alphaproteobacteria bacterium]
MSVVRRKTFALRLHTVFAAILIFVLLLPLSGGYFFRIYENELVRQTEAELIAQAILISSFYKDAFAKESDISINYGTPVAQQTEQTDEKYKPFPPRLGLRAPDILPPRPDGAIPSAPLTPIELSVGNRLTPILEEAKLSTLSSLRVLNPQGTVVAGTGDRGLSLAQPEEVARALTGKYTSVLRQRISDEPRPPVASMSRGANVRVFVAFPIVQNNRVIGVTYLSRSPRNILKALYEEKESVFLAGIFILTVTGVIAWLLSYTIGRPLRALNLHALQLASGDKSKEKLSEPPIEELAVLVQSFEKMSLTIEARAAYIRSFSMHLAHEFKTPLTAIQGAIELMIDHPDDMNQEQRLRFMGNILKDSERLKKLVSRLLELAKADVMQAGHETTDVLTVLNAINKKYMPRVTTTIHAERVFSNIGADILESIMINLIDNSFQHGATGVHISLSAVGNMIELDFVDDGAGISAGNMPKLFTPFFTTRRDSGGTGLGLLISQSLLTAHGGAIAAIPYNSGARFKITIQSLPVSSA